MHPGPDRPPAPPNTHEDLLHYATSRDSLLVFPDQRDAPWLSARRGHRAIGVVYHPDNDHRSNWVPTVIGRRYDAFCFFAATDTLRPLHLQPDQPGGERDTYPWNS